MISTLYFTSSSFFDSIETFTWVQFLSTFYTTANHTNDCYFCMVDPSKRRTGKNAPAIIVYPSIPFSIAPVPHSDQLPVPIPTCCQDPVSADESITDEDDIKL